MIAEALQYFATWMTSPRKVASEIRSSVSLWSRARRQAEAWEAHEEAAQAAVARALEKAGHGRCVVLGSGLLRDVPVRMLSNHFSDVVLIDLQHLFTVRLRARLKGLSNLVFVHRDVSGIDRPEEDPLSFLDAITGLDLVISANLASQIGVGVRRRLGDKKGEALAARLIAAHLEALEQRGCPALLLTDTDYEIRDREGQTIEEGDLLAGADPGAADSEWEWRLAPFGERDPGYEIIHHAMARLIIPPATVQPAARPPLP